MVHTKTTCALDHHAQWSLIVWCLSLYTCIYIYMYVYTYIHIYIYIYICVYIFTYTYTYSMHNDTRKRWTISAIMHSGSWYVWCLCLHTYIHIYKCMYKHIYIYIYIYIYVHIFVYTYVYSMHNHDTRNSDEDSRPSRTVELNMYAAFVCVHSYIYTYIYLYKHIFIYIHTYIYVCVYIYVYILIFMYNDTRKSDGQSWPSCTVELNMCDAFVSLYIYTCI